MLLTFVGSKIIVDSPHAHLITASIHVNKCQTFGSALKPPHRIVIVLVSTVTVLYGWRGAMGDLGPQTRGYRVILRGLLKITVP